jgi:hypothetical protein
VQDLSKPALYNTTYKYPQDTLIPSTYHYKLNSSGTIKGDPLNKSGTYYVNTPNTIKHQLSTNWSNILTKVFDAADVEATPFTTYIDLCLPLDHIEGIVADVGTLSTIDGSKLSINLTTLSDWGPRENPLSIRELESYIKGVEFNTLTTLNALVKSSPIEGGLDTKGVGTLYRLHQDYSTLLSVVDTDWISANSISKGHTEDPTNDTFTAYGSDLLTSASGYDRFVDQIKEDIYMAADGTWRYIFDTIRIPIIQETY